MGQKRELKRVGYDGMIEEEFSWALLSKEKEKKLRTTRVGVHNIMRYIYDADIFVTSSNLPTHICVHVKKVTSGRQ